GVIITKNGIINANRFVASTSSMSNDDMWKFAKLTKEQAAAFSPVFKPHKAGNVVNMGNINANNVLLIGNKVDIQGGKLGNADSTTHLVGNYVYIDADSAKLNSNKINVTAVEGGYTQRQMINFANDGYKFGNNVNIQNTNYTDTTNTTHIGNSNFKKTLTMGNMGNEKDNAIEWWHFAKGWNEGLDNIKEIDEFKLVGDIDFNGMTIDPIAYDYNNAFNKTFNGNGYTLKNITINANEDYNVGLFGAIKDAKIDNINIDSVDFKYNHSLPNRIGAFAGHIGNSSISNISLSNIGMINGIRIVGGFSGNVADSFISNIKIDKIEGINATNEGKFASNAIGVGGFTGMGASTSYNNVILKNIGNISLTNKIGEVYTTYIGYFLGRSDQLSASKNANEFRNIAIYNVGNLSATGTWRNDSLYIGAFAGALHGSKKDDMENIFIFLSNNSKISYNKNFRSTYFGNLAGVFIANLNNIHIYNKEGSLTNATADQAYWNDFNKNGYVSDKI
ncbi:hypothetical protein A7X81_01740, partial [Campylobacter ornithocola]